MYYEAELEDYYGIMEASKEKTKHSITSISYYNLLCTHPESPTSTAILYKLSNINKKNFLTFAF